MPEKERILIVEDDPVVAELFNALLPDHGLEAVVVDDAEQALERLAEGHIDLVLTDKNLPGMSGIDLLAWVKRANPDLDVIIMTAYADMKSAVDAINQGVYDYLVKPFDSIEEVITKIKRALEKRRMKLENVRLIQYLTEANAQIEGMNQELEAEVVKRTKQLQEANARLEKLSVTDDVTGLYNQRFLYQRLEEELMRERRYRDGLAVIMIDLDDFKKVNDSHDHLFGSRVLRRVGVLIRDSVRNIDLTVRYGGDEFVVILPHTDLEAAAVVAERIRNCIGSADVGDAVEPDMDECSTDRYDDRFQVSASLGVASLAECKADSPRSLLRAADKALYAAKEAGRNCIVLIRGDETEALAG